MNREQFEALVWERIDGTLEEADRARLAAYLDAHPEAREWQREIEATARRLGAVKEVPPPEILRARIDASLAASRRPQPPRSSLLARFRDLLVPNFTWGSPVLRAERGLSKPVDRENLGRYLAMNAKRSTVITGFVVLVVVAVLVIAYYSMHRPPAPPENAVGATGVAQRYKAEQIKEGDVRLDLKSEETLDDAIFAVLTEEQKADMLDRLSAERRIRFLAAVNIDEARYAKMDRKQKAALLDRLDASGRAQYFAAFQIDEAQFQAMSMEAKADMLDRLSAERRIRFLAAINIDEARYANLDRKQKAALMDRLATDGGRQALEAVLQIDEKQYQAMTMEAKAEMLDRLSADRRIRFLAAINIDEARYAKMDRKQKAALLDRASADARMADVLSRYCFANMALERMPLVQQAAVWDRMSATGRAAELGRLGIDEAQFQRYDAQGKADALRRLETMDRRNIEDRPRRDRRE